MKSKLFILLTMTLLSSMGYSQKVVKTKGEPAFLSGVKEINVTFDYSKFGVGKFASEKEYLDTKSKEYEAKEPGRGEKFREGWFAARENRYHPKFFELINAHSKGKRTFGEFPDAKYTMNVVITFVEIGFNVGVAKKPAAVSFRYDFFETGNSTKILLSYSQSNVPGSQFAGYDYDVGSRVAESYAKAGKSLAKTLLKVK